MKCKLNELRELCAVFFGRQGNQGQKGPGEPGRRTWGNPARRATWTNSYDASKDPLSKAYWGKTKNRLLKNVSLSYRLVNLANGIFSPALLFYKMVQRQLFEHKFNPACENISPDASVSQIHLFTKHIFSAGGRAAKRLQM